MGVAHGVKHWRVKYCQDVADLPKSNLVKSISNIANLNQCDGTASDQPQDQLSITLHNMLPPLKHIIFLGNSQQ